MPRNWWCAPVSHCGLFPKSEIWQMTSKMCRPLEYSLLKMAKTPQWLLWLSIIGQYPGQKSKQKVCKYVIRKLSLIKFHCVWSSAYPFPLVSIHDITAHTQPPTEFYNSLFRDSYAMKKTKITFKPFALWSIEVYPVF